MCCKTKIKIADSLRALMEEYPLRKITVQMLMQANQMQRQSFYYHFQDLDAVVRWEVERKLFSRMSFDEKVSFTQWVRNVVEELTKNCSFYRQAMELLGRDVFREQFYQAAKAQAQRLLIPDPDHWITGKNTPDCGIHYLTMCIAFELGQDLMASDRKEYAPNTDRLLQLGAMAMGARGVYAAYAAG